MAIKPHQHRKQEAKYGLNPSGGSYSRGLKAMSPCSDSAALSHLLFSCSWAVAGPIVTPVESPPADAVGASESWSVGIALASLCAILLFTAQGLIESKLSPHLTLLFSETSPLSWSLTQPKEVMIMTRHRYTLHRHSICFWTALCPDVVNTVIACCNIRNRFLISFTIMNMYFN